MVLSAGVSEPLVKESGNVLTSTSTSAASQSSLEAVQDINVMLIRAAQEADLPALQEALEKGACVDAVDAGCSAIHLAAAQVRAWVGFLVRRNIARSQCHMFCRDAASITLCHCFDRCQGRCECVNTAFGQNAPDASGVPLQLAPTATLLSCNASTARATPRTLTLPAFVHAPSFASTNLSPL